MPIFVQFSGLTGDATVAPYQGYFNCLSFSWGESISVSSSGIGKPVPSQISLLRNASEGSPLLFLGCAEGKAFSSAKIVFTKTTSSGQQSYLEFDLTECYITGWDIGGETAPVTESLTIVFNTVKYTQYYMNSAGQNVSQAATFNFGTP